MYQTGYPPALERVYYPNTYGKLGYQGNTDIIIRVFLYFTNYLVALYDSS